MNRRKLTRWLVLIGSAINFRLLEVNADAATPYPFSAAYFVTATRQHPASVVSVSTNREGTACGIATFTLRFCFACLQPGRQSPLRHDQHSRFFERLDEDRIQAGSHERRARLD